MSKLVVLTAIAVFASLIFQAFLQPIDFIPVSTSFLSWMPMLYWVALVVAILLWVITLAIRLKDYAAYSVLVLLVGVIFFGIELAERYPRYGDTYAFMYMTNYVLNGFSQQNPVLPYLENWPGWFDFMSAFKSVSGLGYYDSAKAMLVIFQFIGLVLSIALGKAIFKNQRSTFIFSSIVVSLMPWVFVDIAPYVFGALLMVVVIYTLRNTGTSKAIFLFIILFLSSTISHGLTALVILVYVMALLLLFLGAKMMTSEKRDLAIHLKMKHLVLIPILVFGTWGLVSPFVENNLQFFVGTIAGLGTTPITYQSGYLTVFRLPAVLSGAVYLILLALVMAIAAYGTRNRLSSSLLPLVPAGVIVLVVYFFPFTAQDLYDRVIQAVYPLLAWFVTLAIANMARGQRARLVCVALIPVLLVVGFVFFYSHEGVLVFPQTELAGDTYLDLHTPNNTIVGYFSLAPAPATLANTPMQPITVFQLVYGAPDLGHQLSMSSILVSSRMVTNSLQYYYGSNIVSHYIDAHMLNLVYDSNNYATFLRVNDDDRN